MTTSENIFLTKTSENRLFFADASLENKTAGTCDLFLLVDKQSIQLTLKERRSGNLLAFEVLPVGEKKQSDWKQLLENTSSQSKILRNFEFLKVTVGVTTPEYTFVPEALFKSGDESKYFQKNFTINNNLVILAQHVPSCHLYIVFGIDSELKKELNHLFQDPLLLHYSQGFLGSIGMSRKPTEGKQILLNIHSDKADILVSENKKLLLMNSFSFQTNEDILYYTLFVCEQLEINPEKLFLSVTGEVEPGSALFQLLSKYIRNINIPSKPTSISFGNENNDLAFQNYSMLYNLALCE